MESITLRPRKATEIVDAAVEVYRRNPIHFLLLTSIVHVPWLIVQILFVSDRPDLEAVWLSAGISAGTVMTYFMMSGFLVYMASELYLGREIDSIETFKQTWKKLPQVFFGSIFQTMAIGIGLVFFLFPAAWTAAVVFAVVPAIVIEKQSLDAAFRRSSFLSKDQKMHILSVLGLVFLIRVIVTFGIGMVSLLIPMPALRFVVTAAASIIIYPLIAIVDTLVYYDIRIRKEGFDIEMMAGRADAVAVRA